MHSKSEFFTIKNINKKVNLYKQDNTVSGVVSDYRKNAKRK